MAAGYRAKALHNGSFVWGDFNEADYSSTAANQFRVRATGGFHLNSGDMFIGSVPNPFPAAGNIYIENTGGNSGNSFRLDGSANNLYLSAYSALGTPVGAGIVFRPSFAGQGVPETDSMVIKPDGQVGIGTSAPTEKLAIGGNGSAIELGADVTKEPNAGKIGYQKFGNFDALDIVGAGTSGSNRKINLWAEGGAQVIGKMGIGTSAPAAPLEVATSSFLVGRFTNNGAGADRERGAGDQSKFRAARPCAHPQQPRGARARGVRSPR